MPAMRVSLYLRVSTAGQTTDNQEAPLQEWAERNGWNIVRTYRDVASGAKSSRPALNDLLADARRRRFDAVLVTRIDRIARSLPHLLWVTGEMDRHGVVLKDLHSGFDLATSTGRLTLGILGSIAQFERDLVIERTKAGLERARAQGKHCGRPTKALDPADLKRLLVAGKSVADIARELHVSRQTIYSRLRAG